MVCYFDGFLLLLSLLLLMFLLLRGGRSIDDGTGKVYSGRFA